jgi:hypothetical protein
MGAVMPRWKLSRTAPSATALALLLVAGPAARPALAGPPPLSRINN